MATSDSSEEKSLEQPMRKKRRAAQAAEAKFQQIVRGDDDEEDGEEFDGQMETDLPKRGRKSGGTVHASGGIEEEEVDGGSDRGSDDDDEFENEGIARSDEDEDFEDEDDQAEVEKSATSSKAAKEKAGGNPNEYHDFAPPPFLQKILAKRQKEMDNIRRQLPVDSRSREQKLADWYKMLSKLDKPVALLSLITPPQQE